MSLKAVFKEESPVKADFGGIVTGLAATVSVGTVTDGETASVVNSGTAQNAKLDFVLPRGAKGDPGGVVSFNNRTGIVMPQKGDYTAADVGAAPEGFGLGSNPALVTDYDTATKNGWYRNVVTGPDVHSPDGGQWFCLVSTWGSGAIRQDFYAISSTAQGIHAVRFYHLSIYGGWSPFEWVTPPMKLGVEYRTTERWDQKPVYCIAWPGGAFPNNTNKTVEVDTGTAGAVKAVFAHVALANGTMVNGMFGEPRFSETNYIGMFLQNGSAGKFSVTLGSKREVNYDCTIFIKYTRG